MWKKSRQIIKANGSIHTHVRWHKERERETVPDQEKEKRYE